MQAVKILPKKDLIFSRDKMQHAPTHTQPAPTQLLNFSTELMQHVSTFLQPFSKFAKTKYFHCNDTSENINFLQIDMFILFFACIFVFC